MDEIDAEYLSILSPCSDPLIKPRTIRRLINVNIKGNPITLYYIMINPKHYTSVS